MASLIAVANYFTINPMRLPMESREVRKLTFSQVGMFSKHANRIKITREIIPINGRAIGLIVAQLVKCIIQDLCELRSIKDRNKVSIYMRS